MKDKKNQKKNGYISMAVFGLAAGIATRLTDFFSSGGLWNISSIATLFGFWMVTVTLVILRSGSGRKAAGNVFLYLFCMNLAFYGLKYILGFCLPRFAGGGFQTNLFLLYNVLALICAGAAYVLYFWNRGGRLGSLLYALPVGGLAAEAAGVGIYLYHNRTYLFQLLFDFAGFLVLGVLFYRRASDRRIYVGTAALTAIAGYLAVYRPFL